MVVKLETDYFYVPGTQFGINYPFFLLYALSEYLIIEYLMLFPVGVNEDTIPR